MRNKGPCWRLPFPNPAEASRSESPHPEQLADREVVSCNLFSCENPLTCVLTFIWDRRERKLAGKSAELVFLRCALLEVAIYSRINGGNGASNKVFFIIPAKYEQEEDLQ